MEKSIILPVNRAISKIRPVSIEEVKIDGFFSYYLERNRNVSVPYLYRLFEKYGTVENFRVASGVKKGEITRRLATDSDLYKWMEALSWDQQNCYNIIKVKFLDRMIDLVSKAQEKSGYIETHYTRTFKKHRFKFLENSHELYCGGHLIQAAIAHHRSTGKDNFLDIALKWSDFICKKFEKNQVKQNDGHPEVEMALVELYRTTGEKKYLNLSEKLMDMPYVHLGNKKFLQMEQVMGHAVRMMYLLSGATDYYLETGDKKFYEKIKELFDDLYSGKYYITGGVGSRYHGESFGFRYELPNMMAYCETCASIALMMWMYRMFFVEQNPEYFDLFERTLYNAFLSAVSLDGKKYFYVNPLASNGFHQRQDWHKTTCCPPNFQRFMASLPAYFYAAGENEVWINIYDKNKATIRTSDVNVVSLNVTTEYPWSGKVKIDMRQKIPVKTQLYLRIPWWSEKTKVRYQGKINFAERSSYFRLEISKLFGTIEIEFDVRSQFSSCNPAVESNRNCVAITRGPVIYCLEDCDNPFDIFNLFLPQQSLKEKSVNFPFKIIEVSGEGMLNVKNTEILYHNRFPEYGFQKVKFKAIPYFVWANRGKSSMIVWVNACMK
ncbi:MAG: glycoside hydrolase family 127 protein [Candidatus Omnitrophica bacterium]|nr:glycoside hydrolase family 127 protein [Candidatus Omnitrophota bacterium]